MKEQEYDQHVREIAQGKEVSFPWYFSKILRRLYKCLPEDGKSADNTKDEGSMPMTKAKDTVIRYSRSRQKKKKKMQGGTEIFLLENPDGSCRGIRYSRDKDKVFEVFEIAKMDKCRESVATTSGISRVFKNVK